MKNILSCCFLLLFAVSYSAVNFPYPQEISYGNGTINTTSNNASSSLKGKFESFMSGFYEENSAKTMARIKFDTPSQTVSEGIGYGMIMMVYFSDDSKSYQSEFDRLWAYYNNFLNTNGLMNWKISGFTNVAEYNAATDAEFDVALALAMAYYQFGGQKYLDDASSLIKKIREHEMEDDGLHKPGDLWNSKRNPSYVSPAAFEIFKDLDDSDFWSMALTRNYTLLKNNQNTTTGLPSDWCNDNGTVNGAEEFGYDASRAPWRWAWSNAWYGHADAKTLLAKLAPWVNNQTPSNVNGVIKLDGTFSSGCCNNSTFLGPLTNALSYSSDYQTKMNSFWTELISKSGESYFNAAMQIITGLLATGNMPNLKALYEDKIEPSSSSGIELSSSSNEDNDNTPIILSHQAHSNMLSVMQNSVNLQVIGNANVQIFDLKGNEIRALSFAQGNYIVPLSNLPRGLYIVKASNASWKQTVKIAVK